ncbi:hypothetical protein SUGI_0073800 [Cryptomeria japonica]|uniref:scopoletin glucosyltransferase n=1 Tax=Cryptomeria japonica TaxID=3369 RepID=UPI002408C56F|nr:scopoletin glucosyltransferase [Cryptomeria japonica]GLJ07768.1 hypothetical protein SUGI_0073800 [Cryptomeria japonica]
MNGFQNQKPHLVALPFPSLGHSIPFLDMARLLASHGLTVSYVTTAANAPRLQHHVMEAATNGLDIRLAVIPTPAVEGLDGRESAELLPRSDHGLIFQLAEKLQEPFDLWIEQQFQGETETEAPVCIVHDVFMGWARESAEKYKISCIEFNASGAFAVSLLYSVSRTLLQKEARKQDEDSVVFGLDLPHSHKFRQHEIADDFFDGGPLNSRIEFILRRLLSIGKSSGMLINTFKELEPTYVEHLRNLTGKPVWAIGPLLPPGYFSGATKGSSRGKMADVGEDELVQWLDSQSPRSTVYVSFGSETFLSEQQTNALARGLEASGQPFIWAIKLSPTTESEFSDRATKYLPREFLERTKGRGLIIWGWAPQLLILSHSSVAAFMSHCGWNSTLESITLGVPIIAWPMYGDQFFNVRLLAELGLGIQFCEHRPGLPNEEKVGAAVIQVICGEEGREMRTCAEKLREMARKAVEDGGSSKANVQAFASHMQSLRRVT